METVKNKVKRKAVISSECVACGVCIQTCPFFAISIDNGIRAKIELEKCIGCGKCAQACPASVIEILRKENDYE